MINFNKQQQQVINCLEGPCLVISCPGSGKTTTMVARAHKIVESGVKPEKILIMTFTTAAAESMKRKYLESYNKQSTSICFGTIHAVCFHILCNVQGYQMNNLMQETDKWEFFGTLLRNRIDFSEREEFIKSLISEISYMKNKMVPVEKYKPEVCDNKLFTECYYKYEAEKKRVHKIDFDDMLLYTLELLSKDKDILEFYQNRWEYIMVDEFQDTNSVQDNIIAKLVNPKAPNICVVGDDDQGIYGFRSANVDVILNFPKKYSHCKIFHLDKNYRSKPEIIEKAGQLIAHNKKRYKKNFMMHRQGTAEIQCNKYNTSLEQAEFITKKIKRLLDDGEDSIAVLYRTNQENQMFIHRFMDKDIDFYTTEKITDVHNQKVFQDIMSYYRLANGTEQKGDLVSILNRPTRYLKTEVFRDCPFEKNELVKRCANLKNGDNAVMQVLRMIKDVEQLKGKKPADFVNYLYHTMNYEEAFIKYMDFLGKDETEAVMQLELIENEAQNHKTWEEWAEYVSEYARKLKEKRKKRSGVALSSFHSSKGLEWDNVFLINAVEGNVPHKKSCNTVAGTEEERRLFYVAFTRAKNKVSISYVDGGKGIPSCFIREMGLSVRGVR